MLLIDLSNFIIHRYFGIQRWLKFSGSDRNSNEILEQFGKTFEKFFCKFCKDMNISPSNAYFAKDCPRSEIWRNSIYSEYKQNRDKSNVSFDPAIFPHTYSIIMPRLQKKYGFHIIGCEHAEADDIIAVLKRKFRKDSPHKMIYIVSSDRDFLQLKDNFTFLFDAGMKPLLEILEREQCLLQKIIGGDVSDNIRPIVKGIGVRTARNLATNPVLFKTLMESSQEVRDNYELNDLLINLENTPQYIVSNVHSQLESLK